MRRCKRHSRKYDSVNKYWNGNKKADLIAIVPQASIANTLFPIYFAVQLWEQIKTLWHYRAYMHRSLLHNVQELSGNRTKCNNVHPIISSIATFSLISTALRFINILNLSYFLLFTFYFLLFLLFLLVQF